MGKGNKSVPSPTIRSTFCSHGNHESRCNCTPFTDEKTEAEGNFPKFSEPRHGQGRAPLFLWLPSPCVFPLPMVAFPALWPPGEPCPQKLDAPTSFSTPAQLLSLLIFPGGQGLPPFPEALRRRVWVGGCGRKGHCSDPGEGPQGTISISDVHMSIWASFSAIFSSQSAAQSCLW